MASKSTDVKVNVIGDSSQLGGALGKAQGFLGKFKTSISEADGVGGKLKAGFGSLATSVQENAGALAVGAGLAFAKFSLDAVHKFEDTAKAALDFKDKSGLASTEVASQWIAVADDFRVSTGDISTAMLNVTKTIEQSKWKEYGIATHDAGGEVRNVNDVFIDTLDMLGKIHNPTERARVGTELFGKAWGNVAPMVGKTKDEYIKMLGAVSDGQTITDKEAQKAEKMRLAEDALSDAFGDVQLAVGELVAAGAPLVDIFVHIIEKMSKAVEASIPVVDWFSTMTDTITGLVSASDNAGVAIDDLSSKSLGDMIRTLKDQKATVEETAAALKAWAEVHTIASESVKETDRETRKLTTSTEALQTATTNAQAPMETIEQTTKRVKTEAENLDAAWRTLKGTLSNEQAAIDVANQFANVQTAAEDAYIAAANGADDADQKARDYQSSLITLKEKVADYAKEVGGISPEQTTAIFAQIDNGSITNANQVLDSIAHTRQVLYNAQVAGHREFAVGTDNAPPGLALVGENGPELMLLHGGEKIKTAAQTKALLNGASGTGSGTVYNDNRTINQHFAPGISVEDLYKTQRRQNRRGLN